MSDGDLDRNEGGVGNDLGALGRMETIPEAAGRLRAAGYVVDFSATDEGRLRCAECGREHSPDEMQIDETVRYEGLTNPADETILLALQCECGEKGLFYAGFGPNASRAEAAVLRNLP
jgi:hypothetical protein